MVAGLWLCDLVCGGVRLVVVVMVLLIGGDDGITSGIGAAAVRRGGAVAETVQDVNGNLRAGGCREQIQLIET